MTKPTAQAQPKAVTSYTKPMARTGMSPSPGDRIELLEQQLKDLKLSPKNEPKQEDPENAKKLAVATARLEIQDETIKELKEELKSIRPTLQDALLANAALKAKNEALEKEKELLQKQLDAVRPKYEALKNQVREAKQLVQLDPNTVADIILRRMDQSRADSMREDPQASKAQATKVESSKNPRVLEDDFDQMLIFWSLRRMAYITILSHLIGATGDALPKIIKHLALSENGPYESLKKCLNNYMKEQLTSPTAGVQAQLTIMVEGLVLEDSNPEAIDSELRRPTGVFAEKSTSVEKAYCGRLAGILNYAMDEKALARDPLPRATKLNSLKPDDLKAQMGKDSKLLHMSRDGTVGTTFFPPQRSGITKKLQAIKTATQTLKK